MKVYSSNKGEQSGPFSAHEVRAKLRAGELTNKTLYWHEGIEEWEFASELVERLETPKPTIIPSNSPASTDEDEKLIEKCVEAIRQEKRASTSVIQRRLRLGYTRAARIIDLLEQRGILGPGEGAKPRKILVNLDAALALSHLRNCPDCGESISVSALNCPKCGRRLKTEQTAIKVLAAIIIALIVAIVLIRVMAQ